MIDMTDRKKAEMKFKLALKKEAEGDIPAMDKWLNQAAAHEAACHKNGEDMPVV